MSYTREYMTTEEEFLEFLDQISEIRTKIDFQNATPQKNKTLLQYIIELCEKKLEVGNLPADFEEKINRISMKATQDLTKIKNIKKELIGTGANNNNNNNYGYSRSVRPSQPALNSIKAGLFDPNTSPVLRRLQQKLPLTPRKSIIPPNQEKKKTEPSEISSNTKIKGESVEKVIEKSVQKISKKEKPPQIVELQSEPEDLAPFPEPTPFPVAKNQETEPQLMAVYLQIDQIDLKIDLPFESNMVRLGRQDFAKMELKVEVPQNFFDPIIKRSSDQEPSEHCVIEQPSPGEFNLRDRFNSQKTYFLNHFVTQEGTAINDGDTFILPVLIKDEVASLSVKFHLK